MKYECLSVYDSKSRAFICPWFAVNLQVAARSFAEVAKNQTSIVSQFPEDFTLYHLGSWDDNNGAYTAHAQPINLGMAINFQEEGKQNVR